LAPDFGPPVSLPKKAPAGSVHVFTEGKTDSKHLQAALASLQRTGQFVELAIHFDEREDATGDKALLQRCQSLANATSLPTPHIHIFDRDNAEIVRKVEPEGGGKFRDWGNNVYSFAIPPPVHRKNTPDVCIELYYTDGEIKREDLKGRRLFLSSEFNNLSSRHMQDKTLTCNNPNIFRGPQPKIVDGDVYDEADKNVALSKNTFADYVVKRESRFDDFDFTSFRHIFEIIQEIQTHSQV
jgi:RNA-directed DNA polymerase